MNFTIPIQVWLLGKWLKNFFVLFDCCWWQHHQVCPTRNVYLNYCVLKSGEIFYSLLVIPPAGWEFSLFIFWLCILFWRIALKNYLLYNYAKIFTWLPSQIYKLIFIQRSLAFVLIPPIPFSFTYKATCFKNHTA